MNFRTVLRVFEWKLAGSLLLATIVAPAWGQQSDEMVSSRISYGSSVASFNENQSTDTEVDSEATITQVFSDESFMGGAESPSTRRGPLEPMHVPAEHEVTIPDNASSMRLPKLMDPEQYRVQNAKTTGPWFTLQDPAPGGGLPTPEQIRQDSRAANSNLGQAESLMTLLPKTDLFGGILGDSMQQAVMNRDKNFPDPNLTFLAGARFGPQYAPICQPVTKTWRTPDMRNRPLYFEDANLERYGNGIGVWQPVASGMRFFTSVVILPYKIGENPMSECEYSMGYYRPGDCNPAYRNSQEFSRRGAAFEALTIGAILSGL